MALEFEREKNGYDRMEVDMYISKIRDEYENVLAVCRKMQSMMHEKDCQSAIQQEIARGAEKKRLDIQTKLDEICTMFSLAGEGGYSICGEAGGSEQNPEGDRQEIREVFPVSESDTQNAG